MNMNFSSQELNIIESLKTIIEKDTEIYVVGGFLRDKFFQKESFDMDFIVKGQDAIKLAEKFALKTDRYFFPLDEKYEIARVVDKDKLHYFDFARCEQDDIEKDLGRRDLTINAVAYQILPDMKLIDLHDGVGDLNKKIVKIISEANILDDPLRMLRVLRFASQLDFTVDKMAIDVIAKNKSLIKNIAKERILTELIKFFEGRQSAKYLKIMQDTGLLFEIFDILNDEIKIPPNTHHHLSLINHSIETVNQVEKLLPVMPKFVTERLNTEQKPCVKYLSLLKIACLLHDVGKPSTWTIDEMTDRHRFINHDAVGAEMLKTYLPKLKFSKLQTKYITILVKYHIYPSQLARENENANEKAIFRMFRKLEDATPDVLLLAMADRLSAQGVAVTKEMTENNLNALNKYMNMYIEYIKDKKELPKLLDGFEVAKITNLPMGKELGNIVKKLKEAQISGDVLTKDDAINFVTAFSK